jgi:hypothetical protein
MTRLEEAARAAAVPPEPPKEPQITMAELEAEFKADLQRAVDQKRGLDRLHQFQKEQGLRDCKENADAIRDWLDANCEGYVSQDMIDTAVVCLGARGKNVLIFDPVAPPTSSTSPASPQSAEALITLEDGSKQLPLDKPFPKNATKAQAKDYLARVRTANPYIRNVGSFGSRF